MRLFVDPELKKLIPPLSDTEREQLRENIKAEGCRDAIVVWGQIIVDGHNRYAICKELGIPFEVVEREFADKEEAKDWIDANQLGRRNLTPDAFKYLLGRRYNRAKKNQGGTGANQYKSQTHQNDASAGHATADRLAKKHGVSRPTVERAGKFAPAFLTPPCV